MATSGRRQRTGQAQPSTALARAQARERLAQVESILVRDSQFKQICREIDYCATYEWSPGEMHARGKQPEVVGADIEGDEDEIDGQDSVRTREPPCLAILGGSGAGKTTLVETWIRDAQRGKRLEAVDLPYPCVLLDPGIHLKGAAEIMLRALGDPNADRGTLGNMQERLYHLMVERHVRMLFIDEFQHIIDNRTLHVVQDVANFFKTIVKKTHVPLILIGTHREVERVLRDEANEQLARLIGTPQVMRQFAWDRTRQQETILPFRALLDLIDRKLPFESLGLGSEDMAFRFFCATDGYLGRIMEIVRRAAWEAIQTNAPTITLAHFASAYDARIAGTSFGFIEGDDAANPSPRQAPQILSARGGRRSPPLITPPPVPRKNPFTKQFRLNEEQG